MNTDPLDDPDLARFVTVDPVLAYYLTIYTPRFLIDHYLYVIGDAKRADELEQLFTIAAQKKALGAMSAVRATEQRLTE